MKKIIITEAQQKRLIRNLNEGLDFDNQQDSDWETLGQAQHDKKINRIEGGF